ncbi:hypothetical protein GCM10012284_43660 [Mangrovihabitans endophyticus]|uniref:Uncharacterized protein n=1 Tax=Mangrovihabitans endophyticus TaxID=1751298 RepID=A0A8J3C1L2_9ACTN|nr:hypothetical protein GCM10012284_43660 [Mangrovihabitans endophyticus]
MHLRGRRVPTAAAVAAGTVAAMWCGWRAWPGTPAACAEAVSLTVMLAVVAFGPTLGGADESLDRTAAVRWPAVRAGHLLLAAAVVAGPLLLTAGTAAPFGPPALALRDTAGLLGLTALSATLDGPARAWIAPLTWTLIAVMPFTAPGDGLAAQVVTWPVAPAGDTTAAVCATVLAAVGAARYARRGCPRVATPDAPA